jgi:hypothetical protein
MYPFFARSVRKTFITENGLRPRLALFREPFSLLNESLAVWRQVLLATGPFPRKAWSSPDHDEEDAGITPDRDVLDIVRSHPPLVCSLRLLA